jgi:uncharacterized protein YoxC
MFTFWWSIVSTILGVVFLCTSIWQFLEARNSDDKLKSQVKVWMQHAHGISEGLTKIVQDNLTGRYSTTNDVCNAVWSVQSSAFALYQSLYEERCVTEEEYKERQKRIAERVEAQQSTNSNAPAVLPVRPR